MTTNENLLAFDSLTQAYAAEKSGLTSNLTSTRQFDIGEAREKGAGYLELTAPAELLSAKALSMSGVKLSDITSIGGDTLSGLKSLGGDALSGIKSGVQSFTDAASESYDQMSSYINNLYNSLTTDVNMYRFNGTSLEPELDPEFGVTADDAMVAVGQVGRPAASVVEASLAQAPTESATVAGGTEVAETAATAAGSIGEAGAEAGVAATSVATDAAAGALEGVGAALDSTGIGAPIGLIVGLAGIGLGGFSLFDGIRDIFGHRSDSVTLPNLNLPNFQAT